ncbi:MAG: dihydropteroate synthase [Armatimonadota bacterium]
MSHRARVLDLQSPDELLAELRAVGVPPTALAALAERCRFRPVRLSAVDGRAAALLRQEMLALGGECAVHRGVAQFDDTPRAAVLLGDAGMYARLAQRLADAPFGLAQIARDVLAAVEAYDAERIEPLECAGRILPLRQRTLVMGIINVTLDSFSGDGLGADVEAAVERGRSFAAAGADILDVGGESTRPGSAPVPVEEELERVLPVVEALAELDVVVSIDTSKPEVARLALAAGAGMVNDVYGLRAEGMIETIADTGAAACIMHMQGEPRTMQQAPHYEDLMAEVYDFLAERVAVAEAGGVPRSRLVIDPGFGFGKTVAHNLELLRRLRELRSLGVGVLIGTSRKSTIGAVLEAPVEERLMGTAATCALAIANGADIIRVHDVAEMAAVARMTDAVVRGWREAS